MKATFRTAGPNDPIYTKPLGVSVPVSRPSTWNSTKGTDGEKQKKPPSVEVKPKTEQEQQAKQNQKQAELRAQEMVDAMNAPDNKPK